MLSRSRPRLRSEDEYKDGDQIEDKDQDELPKNKEVALELARLSSLAVHVLLVFAWTTLT